ncbi:hypothetical protein [Mesorhizobium sp. B2-7-2]|uniref:hypothetical protein n=1 Tax=Mesorhizobium sp. B2-7-2 TaxID=2589908 RepID=UPI0011266590|nr:hypothetical protein [Mesorhizobium sp. B2-7-2]TPJ28029.1 hypothetical protein FJ425_13390 [Mesorhizobium sp. B2-7-2]
MVQDNDDEVSPPRSAWQPSGRRRSEPTHAAKPTPILWPKKGQHAMVDLWVFVAAQMAETKDHFRVLLAIDKAIRRDTGTTPDGNEVLARWAGGMSITNTSKAISFLAKAGLLVIEMGFAADRSGKLRKARTIRLAMPEPFPEWVSIELPYRQLNPNQLGARGQVESVKTTWPRVSADGARGQISDEGSLPIRGNRGTPTRGSAEFEAASQLPDDKRGEAARPERRASHVSTSPSAKPEV